MNAEYKPATYPSVSPYLIVDGAYATIAFLTRAFDAKLLRSIPGDAGNVRHAEVLIVVPRGGLRRSKPNSRCRS